MPSDPLSPSLDDMASTAAGNVPQDGLGQLLSSNGAPQQDALGDFIESLGRPRGEPKVKEYPSNADADFAIQSGFAYGKPWERYFDNHIARMMNDKDVAGTLSTYDRTPTETVMVDSLLNNMNKYSKITDDPAMLATVRNRFARAALAANRHPISALGFDPSKTVLDLLTKRGEIGGREKNTNMYVNRIGSRDREDFSSIVHESTHAGLEKIRRYRPDLYHKISGGKDTIGMDEEMMVRHIMDTVMGSPEYGSGVTADQQIEQSRQQYEFNKGLNPRYPPNQMLDLFTKAAIDIIKQTRPKMGPR